MSRFKWLVAGQGLALGVIISASASAQLRVTAGPTLGPNTPSHATWMEYSVRIDNDDSKPIRGTVELSSQLPTGNEDSLVTRAPFQAQATSTITIRLPARAYGYGGTTLQLRVLNENGREMATQSVAAGGGITPFLLDASEPPRLAGLLREVPVFVSYDPTGGSMSAGHGSSGAKASLATGSVQIDPTTGDPVLPDRAAAYASTTVVLMRSDQFARISGSSLDALGNYVLGGGALAIAMVRPEDLRNPSLATMIGAEIRNAPVPEQLKRQTYEITAPEDKNRKPGAPRARTPAQTSVGPSQEVTKSLSGYAGGNLHPSLFGASATYGLGEIHLLAFDPTRAPGVDDPWVQGEIVELVRHAWDRRVYIVSPHASAIGGFEVADDVRKYLDPNESSRWAIIVAAIFLCAYSGVVGPLNFGRAAKKGFPLRALRWVPLYSGITFALIVILGIAAKGWTGKSRHLTLVEAGAGMSKANARRFRGFYTSQSRAINVRASDFGSVLDIATDNTNGARRALLVDRDGVRLEGLATMPWETVVVREDGFTSLGGGLSVVQDGADLILTNRTARDLRALLVILPATARSRQVMFIPRLKDGESKKASEGKKLTAFTPWTSGMWGLNSNDFEEARDSLEGESKGLSNAWTAIGESSGRQVQWWPEDVPIVMAQIDGGEGGLSDSGLWLERDRVLLRVIGYGGVQ